MGEGYEKEPTKGTESDKTTKSYPGQGKKVGQPGATGVRMAQADSQDTEERVNCDPTK